MINQPEAMTDEQLRGEQISEQLLWKIYLEFEKESQKRRQQWIDCCNRIAAEKERRRWQAQVEASKR